MALGLDKADRLNSQRSEWNDFLEAWKKRLSDRGRPWTWAPTHVGRYFGKTSHRWVPGELSTLPPDFPLAQSLRYVWPIAPTGPISTVRKAKLSGHGLPQKITELELDLFYRQQGETDDGLKLKGSVVRQHGRDDAVATCNAIARALSFVDPTTHRPELVLPDSERVFVFLDVEPQTTLSPYYWLGWAEAVSSFVIWKPTTIGTASLSQPLRPCLYCVCDENGPWDPEITSAFPRSLLGVRLRSQHTCHGLATGGEDIDPLDAALEADDAAVRDQWFSFGTLDQAPSAPASVVIWQYQINVAMDATKAIFSRNDEWTRPSVFDIDLNATSEEALDGRPITDYMLRRP